MMSRCLSLLFFLAVFPVCFQTEIMVIYEQTNRQLTQQPQQPVKQLPARPKRYALVIGVDKYQDTQITTLGGAANDARTLANALIQYAGFPPEQVTLLATDQPAERQPTRGNILRRLSNMRGAVPPDGMLLVAYAGHGMERGGQAYLLPSDSQVSGDIRLLEETAIHVNRMRAAIKETGVKQILLILDACRNDPAGRANADNPLTQAYTGGFNFDVRNQEVNAFVTLYATAVGQRAFEYKEKMQGYFTWELVEALKGQAANERGEVTLAGLVRHLQTQVPKRVKLELGKDQTPYVVIEGYKADELVIAVKGKVLSDAIYKEPAMPQLGSSPGGWPVNPPIPSNVVVEPETFGAFYYLDKNRSLTVLERKVAQNKFGAGTAVAEIAGDKAPLRLREDKPSFVFRLASGADSKLEFIHLTIRNGMRTVDLLKRRLIPCDVVNYGPSSYKLTPVEKLVPGEYALSAPTTQEVFLFGIDGDGKTIPLPAEAQDDGKEITISAAQAYGASNYAIVSMVLAGIDNLGGTDVKVLINGQDVTSYVNNQSGVSIILQGTAKALNLKNGENEVVIKVGKNSSVPYKFRMRL